MPRFNAASTSACSCARLAAVAPGRAGRAGVAAAAGVGAGAGAGVAGGRPRAAGEGILSNRASGGAVACAVTAARRDGRCGFDAEPGGSLEGVNGALAAVPGASRGVWGITTGFVEISIASNSRKSSSSSDIGAPVFYPVYTEKRCRVLTQSTSRFVALTRMALMRSPRRLTRAACDVGAAVRSFRRRGTVRAQ